jgi:hypothetical protein
MKPFSKLKADGSSRNRRAVTPKSPQRSRRANGRLAVDGRSARGRRIKELCEAFGIGANMQDAQIAGLVRSTAALAVEVEDCEDALDRGEPVDRSVYAKLINSRERALRKLSEMKAAARAGVLSSAKGQSGWSSPLQRHLHFMHWTENHRGETSFAEAVNDPAFMREYERLEREGEFVNEAR